MRIRPAAPADVPAILGVERACATAAHWNEGEYEKVFSPDAIPRLMLVAEDAAVRGFIVVRILDPEWEIENVAVLPDQRGRGVGLALVTTVLRRAQQANADAVVLEVRASNAAARSLYRRAGFVETGTRRGYYSGPEEDAALFRWPRTELPVAP